MAFICPDNGKGVHRCEHKIIKQCAFVHVGLENITMGCPNLMQIHIA